MDEEKRIDEGWKDKAASEKTAKDAASQENFIPEASFAMLVSSLGIQTTVALGEIENPITNKKETDLNQAKYLIDTLGILQEKTKNNLSKEEEDMLENILYQLRTIFLNKQKEVQK